ncbi:hypothetical protein DY000_02024562 [Brassica cretica]|uniref:Uncharacterized protein n=1 Tax=Brassica cretica TaxID=69181 RepID=A0ABQ7ELI9_BRACR|nr:hypothetical protein DY000_02024562 [Brassica cretica]
MIELMKSAVMGGAASGVGVGSPPGTLKAEYTGLDRIPFKPGTFGRLGRPAKSTLRSSSRVLPPSRPD